MHKVFWLAPALFVVACGGGGTGTGGTGGTGTGGTDGTGNPGDTDVGNGGDTDVVGGDCTTEGETRCTGLLIETCTAGAFVTTETCTARCVANPDPTCYDLDDINDELANVYADAPVAADFQYIEVGDFADTESFDIEIYQGFGADVGPGFTGAVSLSGVESSYDTCGVCVFGYVGNKVFMAEAGSINFTSVAINLGENLTFSATDIVLREVLVDATTFATTDVPGGERWFIEQLDFDVTATPWPCDFDGTVPGDVYCEALGERLIECLASDATYTYDYQAVAQDCLAESGTCVDPGTAACIVPCVGQNGAIRCTRDILETCTAEVWETTIDCSAVGDVCDDTPGPAACTSCGNGGVDTGEDCDDQDLGVATGCADVDVSFVAGTLACASDCSFDTAACQTCATAGCADPNASCVVGLCTCDTGYEDIAGVCTNIDECVVGGNDCDVNADCTDLTPLWSCACKPGFTGNGVTCVACPVETCDLTPNVCVGLPDGADAEFIGGPVSVAGTLPATGNRYQSTCGGNGPEVAYAWTPPSKGKWRLVASSSAFDPTLSVYGPTCGTEVGCHDDLNAIGGNFDAQVDYLGVCTCSVAENCVTNPNTACIDTCFIGCNFIPANCDCFADPTCGGISNCCTDCVTDCGTIETCTCPGTDVCETVIVVVDSDASASGDFSLDVTFKSFGETDCGLTLTECCFDGIDNDGNGDEGCGDADCQLNGLC